MKVKSDFMGKIWLYLQNKPNLLDLIPQLAFIVSPNQMVL